MKFDWDKNKNAINIQKHGIDFVDVIDIFDHPMLTMIDNRENYEEERWIGIGWLKALIGVVVYTERVGNTIRIISARKATKQEVKRYEQSIKY
jgi:uncharacterized DUF497 family protein